MSNTIVLPSHIKEIRDQRTRQPFRAQWGRGWTYSFGVNCPVTKIDDVLNATDGVFRRGVVAPQQWIDHNIEVKASDPRLQAAVPKRAGHGTVDSIRLTYVEVAAGTETNGYAECTGVRQRTYGVARDTIITWRVALTGVSSGIPDVEDVLDGADGTVITHFICGAVQIYNTMSYGRVVVRATWSAARAGGYSQRS